MVGLIIATTAEIIGIVLLIITPIAWFWTDAIENMQEKHPDYKGEEFLNWDRKNDDWDVPEWDIKDWDITLMDGLEEEEDLT